MDGGTIILLEWPQIGGNERKAVIRQRNSKSHCFKVCVNLTLLKLNMRSLQKMDYLINIYFKGKSGHIVLGAKPQKCQGNVREASF